MDVIFVCSCQFYVIALIYLRMENEHKRQNVVPQQCPVCAAKTDFLYAAPISQSDDQMTVHVRCEQCAATLMVFVTHNDVGMITFGVMVEVDHAEATRFFCEDPIMPDDVISLHRHMKNVHVSVEDVCGL